MPAKQAPKGVTPAAPAAVQKKTPARSVVASVHKVQREVSSTAPAKVSQRLIDLLNDQSATARSITEFVMGPSCGLESIHKIKNFNNVTPFLLAVEANRLDVVQLLVAEFPVNIKEVAAYSQIATNYTAIHIATRNGHLEMTRYLVEQCGLDMDACDSWRRMPLHWAISSGHSDAALLLLELGANPCLPDNNGKWTPLHLACREGQVDVVQQLLAEGGDIDFKNDYGASSLLVAIHSSRCEVILLLLELGADPNKAYGFDKWTPLHHACSLGLVDVARLLLAEGASRDALNKNGKTPLDLANKAHQTKLAALLGTTP